MKQVVDVWRRERTVRDVTEPPDICVHWMWMQRVKSVAMQILQMWDEGAV